MPGTASPQVLLRSPHPALRCLLPRGPPTLRGSVTVGRAASRVLRGRSSACGSGPVPAATRWAALGTLPRLSVPALPLSSRPQQPHDRHRCAGRIRPLLAGGALAGSPPQEEHDGVDSHNGDGEEDPGDDDGRVVPRVGHQDVSGDSGPERQEAVSPCSRRAGPRTLQMGKAASQHSAAGFPRSPWKVPEGLPTPPSPRPCCLPSACTQRPRPLGRTPALLPRPGAAHSWCQGLRRAGRGGKRTVLENQTRSSPARSSDSPGHQGHPEPHG